MVRPSRTPAASGSRHGEGPESGVSAMECEARAPAREGMTGESVAAKTGAGLVRELWPECAREPAQAPVESLHRMVSGFLASEPSWKDVFLRGVETEPFALVVARLVEELPQQTKRNSRAAAETVTFLTDCLDHLHLKCVREAILPLLGFRLWKFVDPERLQAHLRSSERVKRQWNALEQANSENPDLTMDTRVEGFWSLLLQLATGKTLIGEPVHLETFETDHPLPVTILSFVRSCLRSPITRRFLLLLLESLHFVALCTASGKFDRSAWLLTDIDNLVECGEKSDEEVDRFVVARLRLFQRVAFRHFENSLGATVLGPTAMVSNAIQEGALEQLEYQEVKELVQKLGLAYSAKASDVQEEKDREFCLQLLRSKHQTRKGYHGLLRELEREGAMWKLALPGERQTDPFARAMSMPQVSVLVEQLHSRIQSCQPQLQYLSESELLWYETRRLCDQSVMAAAVDILSAAELLELAVDPTTKKLTASGWSRMAARALLRTATSGTLDLSGAPDMVLNEWSNLAHTQDIVIFAEFTADSQGVTLGGVFAGRLLALDRATGQVTLQWSSNHKPFPREGTVIVAIRGNAATDTYRRKVKCLLASAVARTGPKTLLPPTLASALLGQAQLAHPTLAERIKLFQSRRSESGLDTNTVAQLVQGVQHGSSERVLIVSYTAAAAFSIEKQVKDSSILLTAQPNDGSLATAVSTCLAKRMDLLEQVGELAEGLGINTGGALTCEGANVFFELYVKPELDRYIASLSQEGEPADFPFAFFFGGRDNKKTANKFEVNSLRTMFQELETLRIFELVLDPKERHRLVLERQAQVVVASLQSVVAHLTAPNWQERRLHFTRIVLLESSRMNMGDMLLVLSLLASPERVDSFYCVGDAFGDFPRGPLDEVTVFERMTRLGGTVVPALQVQDMAPTASSLHKEVLQAYRNSACMNRRDVVFPGVLHCNNFVRDPGSSEIAVGTGQFQNVSEAEYLVALYQYLLLIGYHSTQVAILCTYKAQELLVLDVLHSRCNPLRMPLPSLVTAVEDMPDHTWDIVLVSLVRTSERGLTSDLRRQVAIFQAARLGLFVIGNRDLYREDMMLASLMKDDDTQGGLVLFPQERFPGNPERSSQSEDKSVLVKSAKDMSILATQMIMARQQN